MERIDSAVRGGSWCVVGRFQLARTGNPYPFAMLPDLEYAALRLETFLDEVLRPLATPHRHALSVSVFQSEDRLPLAQAREATFDEIEPGWRWGPVWSTCWFRLQGEVPAAFVVSNRPFVSLWNRVG